MLHTFSIVPARANRSASNVTSKVDILWLALLAALDRAITAHRRLAETVSYATLARIAIRIHLARLKFARAIRARETRRAAEESRFPTLLARISHPIAACWRRTRPTILTAGLTCLSVAADLIAAVCGADAAIARAALAGFPCIARSILA
ncbi:MAG: hypothetical protein AAB853_02190 [Patescibacteria group bacterium]